MSQVAECRQNLKTMIVMREFERVIKDLANKGFVEGAVHCYTGEEAVALGICNCLNRDDYVFSTHRGHGHAIAKGLNLNRIFAEIKKAIDNDSLEGILPEGIRVDPVFKRNIK